MEALSPDASSVKILVAGDSGVGKSSLVHLLSHGKPLQSASCTVGCAVEIMICETSDLPEKQVFVELWDVGGSNQYADSRGVFYDDVDGLVLVHDLNNMKSYENLRRWHSEVMGEKGGSTADADDVDPEQLVGSSSVVPTLVVGTKLDQASGRGQQRLSLSSDLMAASIDVNCLDASAFKAPNRNDGVVSDFIAGVVRRKFKANHGGTGANAGAYGMRGRHVDNRPA